MRKLSPARDSWTNVFYASFCLLRTRSAIVFEGLLVKRLGRFLMLLGLLLVLGPTSLF